MQDAAERSFRKGIFSSSLGAAGLRAARPWLSIADVADALTHSVRRVGDPERWVLYLSHVPPARLVVFIHGFRGGAVRTWQRFPEGARTSDWWEASDLLFVGYPSQRDNITGTASRLRRELPRFFPRPPSDLLEIGDVRVRALPDGDYEELVLVGHSLGGVVLRRALCDAADEWLERISEDPSTPKPCLLEANMRLFSPASAGFRPAGLLGFLSAGPAWLALNMYLRSSSAFADLQQDSAVLAETRRRTEQLVKRDAGLEALRARILWANPDQTSMSKRSTSETSWRTRLC